MQSASLKLAKQKADKYFSLYIRQRDSINDIAICCTCCKRSHFKQVDAGHFISRRYEATRYDEINVNAQCRHCNRFNQGKQYEYGLFIDKKYGPGTAEKILQKSQMLCKRSKYDYEVIAEYYKNKCK